MCPSKFTLGRQSIPDSGLIDDVLRYTLRITKFLAQLTDVDAQVLNVLAMRRSPDLFEQHAMRAHTACGACEHGEKFEFLRRQLDRLTFEVNLVTGHIDAQ